MAEYIPPQDRPVVRIDRPILTPQQEQEKWLEESTRAVKAKGEEMRRVMASTSARLADNARHDSGAEEAAGGKTTSNAGGFLSVVRAAAAMLEELRSSTLAPHNYYELYIAVFDEMQAFTQYVEEEHRLHGRALEEMYEAVQYVGHILPRLYMLIAVGSVFLASSDAPALALFQDLVEMCKGVQHPTRGLFLRHFLLNMTKNLLPGDMNRARPNVESEDGGTPVDTATLIVHNAREMNWLWIRMEAKWYGQNISSVLGVKGNQAMAIRRTQNDRKELRVLVGMNIVRISQLEGIDVETYRSILLPLLMNIIMNYREPVAQQYLFEVVVQVFPDEFHIHTLDILLQTVQHLTATVDVSAILQPLMERLGNYAVALREGRTEVSDANEEELVDNMFSTLLDHLEQMPVSYSSKAPELREIKRSSSTPPVNPIMLGTYVLVMISLARMAAKASPSHCAGNISAVLQCVADKFASAPTVAMVVKAEWERDQREKEAAFNRSRHKEQSDGNGRADGKGDADAQFHWVSMPAVPVGGETVPAVTAAAISAAEKLIATAMGQVRDVDKVLSMDGLASLIGQLPFRARRTAAIAMCDAALSSTSSRQITSLDGVSRLFEIMDPMLCDQEDAPEDPRQVYAYDPLAEFNEEQQTVCRVLHLVDSKDAVVYVKELNGIRKLLGQGGTTRVPRTFPTLASLYMRAALRLYVNLKDAAFAVEEERLAARAAKYMDPNSGNGGGSGEADAAGSAEGLEQEGTTDVEQKKAEKKKGKKKKEEDEEEADDAPVDPKKRLQQLDKQLNKVFKHLHSGDGKGILEILAACESGSVTAFYAYLTAASTADTCERADDCYELYAEAFTLYEARTADSRDQLDLLVSIVNSLCATRNLPADSYSTLATKACRYCSKLVKKQDQSRMVAMCANLFAKKDHARHKNSGDKGKRKGGEAEAEEATEGESPQEQEASAAERDREQREVVLECLQRALKTAKQVASPLQQLALYVDLLNILLHFYASKTVQLEASYVNTTLDTIRTLSESQRTGGTVTATHSANNGGDRNGDAETGAADAPHTDGEESDTEQIGKVRRGPPGSGGAAAPSAGGDGNGAEKDSQEEANFAATFDAIRQIYRNTTKYIRSRQSVDPRWEELEV